MFSNNRVIKIKVHTDASKTELLNKLDDGTYRMNVRAVPKKGRANTEIIKYFSRVFKINKKNVKIISGKTGSRKIIKIKQ
ncbi:MAG: DUF167 domain-containing protein [Patescibacteria group bacterium]|nr:DUF167 domain-containing protein [Patescibacteria group bacterium]